MPTFNCQLCQTVLESENAYCPSCLVKAVHVRRFVLHGLTKEVAVFVQYGVRGDENKKVQQAIWG